MPSYLLKIKPESQHYVLYSTIVDSVTAYGTKEDFQRDYPEDYPDERFERADSTGTSCKLGWYGYDDEEITLTNLHNVPGWFTIMRKDLEDFSLEFFEASYATAEKCREVVEKYCAPLEFED